MKSQEDNPKIVAHPVTLTPIPVCAVSFLPWTCYRRVQHILVHSCGTF